METKILKELAELRMEVLIYAMNEYCCTCIKDLVKVLAKLYIKEDVWRIQEGLNFIYETRDK